MFQSMRQNSISFERQIRSKTKEKEEKIENPEKYVKTTKQKKPFLSVKQEREKNLWNG